MVPEFLYRGFLKQLQSPKKEKECGWLKRRIEKERNYFKTASKYVSLSKHLIMQILQQAISIAELKELAQNTFGDMIKCVADVKRGLLAIDADLHADLERLLLEDGSAQEDLWGFNLWVEEKGDDFIEFDSLINIRSWQGNPSRDVENPEIRESIKAIVQQFITD